MSYQFIASRWFTPGRIAPITLIVLHTIECPCETGMARAAAELCARRDEKISAHYFTDPSTVIQGVKETDTAYCAPGANANGIHIEQAGYARFSVAQWSEPKPVAMEQVTAALIADIAVRRNIPLHFVPAAELVAQGPAATGVTTHWEVAKAFHKTDHTDPGPYYPMDYVLIEARALLNLQEDDMLPCVIPANAQPLSNGRFPYFTFHNDGGGQWSVRGANGAQLDVAGAKVASTVLPLASGVKPLGMTQSGGFLVAVAEDDATYAYVIA